MHLVKSNFSLMKYLKRSKSREKSILMMEIFRKTFRKFHVVTFQGFKILFYDWGNIEYCEKKCILTYF